MLIENDKLYDALECVLTKIFLGGVYVKVFAIYEPDDDGGKHEGMYHAAVDMYRRGETYHVWFVVNDDDSITISDQERWYMG